MKDEIYVGYLDQAPPAIAGFAKRSVFGLLVLVIGVGCLLAAWQDPFDSGTFEYAQPRDFEGVVRLEPYPMLLVERPGEGSSHYLLVGLGKHGAGEQVEDFAGKRVRLRGSLIYADERTMVEVEEGSIKPVAGRDGSVLARQDLGVHTLTGEIVDSKCYLGVMKPGRDKPHRACATLCIAGGIPPVLRVETGMGDRRLYVLTDEKGLAVNDRVLGMVAEPVEIVGRVERQGDLYFLAADPAGYRRVGR